MAESETLREFLVSLNYKIDSSSENKFRNSVESATKMVTALAAAVVSMGVAVEAAVVQTARQFDQLYWASQRAGATAANVKALSYAISQVGGSADSVQSSLANFANNLRSNPGFGGWLKELGVATSQGGKVRDNVDVMLDLVDRLSKQYTGNRYGIGASIAAQFGIDSETYYQISHNREELQKRFSESTGRNSVFGFDPDKAAQSSRDLMREIRELVATLSTLRDKILVDLGPALLDTLKTFNQWVIDHKDGIVRVFNEIVSAVNDMAKKLAEIVIALKPLGDAFDQMTEKLTGKSGLYVAIETLTIAMAGIWLVRLTSFAGGLGSVVGKLGLFLTAVEGVKKLGDILFPPENQTVPDIGFWDSKVGQGLGWLGNKLGLSSGGSGGTTQPINNAQQRENALSAYRLLRGAGYTHDMAIGVLSNLSAESGFNPTSRGDGGDAHGAAQWHSDRRAKILAGTGIDVSTASWEDQVRALIWEQQHGAEQGSYRRLQGARSPEEAAGIVSQYYERPADVTGAASDRMGRATSLNGQFSDSDLLPPPGSVSNSSSTNASIHTTVNLYGDYDGETGDDISRRVNAPWELIQRNSQSATR